MTLSLLDGLSKHVRIGITLSFKFLDEGIVHPKMKFCHNLFTLILEKKPLPLFYI